MAVYDFRCTKCDRIERDVVLPMTHSDSEHPQCCESMMADYITSAPMVTWKDKDLPDGGFKAGKEGTVITSMKERREYMARNDLIDANELGPPPTAQDQIDQNKKAQETLEQFTPTPEQMADIKRSGALDILPD